MPDAERDAHATVIGVLALHPKWTAQANGRTVDLSCPCGWSIELGDWHRAGFSGLHREHVATKVLSALFPRVLPPGGGDTDCDLCYPENHAPADCGRHQS